MTYIIGVDEAGRGPLAGPVAVGTVKIKKGFNPDFFKGIKDSKKLKEKDREDWFAKAQEARVEGRLDFAVSLVSEKIIDKKGISFALRLGISRNLKKLRADSKDKIFLDGSLFAPAEFINQETIIKGDEKVAVISLASICAKVTRDRYMTRLSKKHPQYGFEKHKGYGTKMHTEAIRKHGVLVIHRKSFLKSI